MNKFDSNFEKRAAHIKAEKQKAKDLRKTAWWDKIRQSAQCYYCQQKMNYDEVTMDHIVPLSRGGFSKKGNIVASCKNCNTLKKDSTAVDLIFQQIQQELS